MAQLKPESNPSAHGTCNACVTVGAHEAASCAVWYQLVPRLGAVSLSVTTAIQVVLVPMRWQLPPYRQTQLAQGHLRPFPQTLSSRVLAKQEPCKLKSRSDAPMKPEGQIRSLPTSCLQPTVGFAFACPGEYGHRRQQFSIPTARRKAALQDTGLLHPVRTNNWAGKPSLGAKAPSCSSCTWDAPGRHCWPRAQLPEERGTEPGRSGVLWAVNQRTGEQLLN